ncbi:MAG: SH3 domain-containing protein [Clostridiales bacterium]|nr:SH3 domain-containing protein [Clostridiales bacterium]
MKMQISEGKRKIIHTVVQLLAVVLLLITFYGTYGYMQKNVVTKFQKNSTDSAGGEGSEETQELARTGTWCTIKSNSLDGVPIYEEAGSTFQTAFIPEGKCCEVVTSEYYEEKLWARVSYCGLEGWLNTKYLNYISEDACYISEGDTVYMNTIADKGISGYEEPTASSAVAREGILYGTEFTVLTLENGCGELEENGRTVWINMYLMGSYPVSTWKVETLSSAAEINFREQPGETAKSLCKVPENTELVMEEFQNGWGKTTYEGQEGWVMLHYLTPVEG